MLRRILLAIFFANIVLLFTSSPVTADTCSAPGSACVDTGVARATNRDFFKSGETCYTWNSLILKPGDKPVSTKYSRNYNYGNDGKGHPPDCSGPVAYTLWVCCDPKPVCETSGGTCMSTSGTCKNINSLSNGCVGDKPICCSDIKADANYPDPGSAANPCPDGVCYTIFGPINALGSSFINQLFRIILSISGGIALLMIIASGYSYAMSQGNPEKIKSAQEGLTSAIIGLLFIIFSTVILQIIGADILGLPQFFK